MFPDRIQQRHDVWRWACTRVTSIPSVTLWLSGIHLRARIALSAVQSSGFLQQNTCKTFLNFDVDKFRLPPEAPTGPKHIRASRGYQTARHSSVDSRIGLRSLRTGTVVPVCDESEDTIPITRPEKRAIGHSSQIDALLAFFLGFQAAVLGSQQPQPVLCILYA